MRNRIIIIASFFLFVAINVQANNDKNTPDKSEEISQAHYIGSEVSFQEYIKTNLVYPSCARDKGLEGKVTVSFFVLPDGSIHKPRVTEGIDDACDKVALDIIEKMPNWKPAEKNGKPVASRVNVVINFRLVG